MGEITRRITIQYLVFHAQLVEEFWQDNASDRVDGVDAYLEVGVLDCLFVNEFKVKHVLDMPVVSLVTIDIVSQSIHLGILKILSLSQLQHLSTIGSRKELSLTVE